MHIDGVLNLLGRFLIVLSLVMLLPIPVSLYYHEGLVWLFLLSSCLGLLLGFALLFSFMPRVELSNKEGFAIVVLSWLGLSLMGSLPYFIGGAIPCFVDAFFESMSGFTTTGSTILADIEVLPRSLLFWRAMTHWLGGMGIIVLALAVLPLLKIGGAQLFQAEVPGPVKERLTPRIQDTARILWFVYFALTLLETALLMFGGLDFFHALTHSFSTLSTGGFANFNSSIAYYQSNYVQAVIMLFMFLAGMNFSFHFLALKGNFKVYWKSEEFRLYVGLIVAATAVIVIANQGRVYHDFGLNFRDSLFQVIALVTSTGFGTADFDTWPSLCKVILVAIMIVGGCAGSTAGGLKMVRVLLFFKYARLQLRKLIHPNLVENIKLGQVTVKPDVMTAILGFLAIFCAFFLLALLLVTAMGVDIVTATTAVITTLNNMGPGLAEVGPSHNFGGLPSGAKMVLIFCMLAGRLELYTVVIFFMPSYHKLWRKPTLRWQKKKQDRVVGEKKE